MTNDSQSTTWEECPRGTLSGLSTCLRRRQCRQQIARISGVLSVVLMTVAAGWYTLRSTSEPGESHYGGITCSEVHDSVPAYLAGELEPAVIERINAHFSECSGCRKYMEQQRQLQTAGNVQVRDRVPRMIASRF